MSDQKELTNLIGSKPIERKLRKAYFKLEDVLQKYQPVVYETEVWPRIDLDTPAGHCPFICSREEHKDRLQLHDDLKKGTATSKRKSLREKRIKRTINYCECCGCSISCLDKHLESTEHKSFVENKENYTQVDDFIEDLNKSSDGLLDQYIQRTIEEQNDLDQFNCSKEENKENTLHSANDLDLDDTLSLSETAQHMKNSTALRTNQNFESNSTLTPKQFCGTSELLNSSILQQTSVCASAGFSAQIDSLSVAFKSKANTKTPKTPPIQKLLTSPGFQLQNFNITITPGSMQITPRRVDLKQPMPSVAENELEKEGCNQELKQRKKRLFSPVSGNERLCAQNQVGAITDLDRSGKRFKSNPLNECDLVYADALPSLVKCPDLVEICEPEEPNSTTNVIGQGIASDCTTPTMSTKSVVVSSSGAVAIKPEFGSPSQNQNHSGSSDESAHSPIIGTKLCISSRPGYLPVQETREQFGLSANEESVTPGNDVEEENESLNCEIEGLVAKLLMGNGMPALPSMLSNQPLDPMETSPHSQPANRSPNAINSSTSNISPPYRLKPARELTQDERVQRRRLCSIFNKKLKHKFDVTSFDDFAKGRLDIAK